MAWRPILSCDVSWTSLVTFIYRDVGLINLIHWSFYGYHTTYIPCINMLLRISPLCVQCREVVMLSHNIISFGWHEMCVDNSSAISLYIYIRTNPTECPVEGQEYYDGVNTCVPCTGTCEEPEVACLAVCRSGCGCPVGTVLDEEANACVNLTDCPPGEPQYCHMTITGL